MNLTSNVDAQRTPRFVIVGAGMSGLCMGMKLKRAGIESFTIYEKAEEVGGTWRENRIPGSRATCRRASTRTRSPPTRTGRSVFSPGAEIRATSRDCARASRPALAHPLRRARSWRRAGRTAAGASRPAGAASVEADVLVSAAGCCTTPACPRSRASRASPARLSLRALGPRRRARRQAGRRDRHRLDRRADRDRARRTAPGGCSLFQRTAQWILPVPNRAVLAADSPRVPPLPGAEPARLSRLPAQLRNAVSAERGPARLAAARRRPALPAEPADGPRSGAAAQADARLPADVQAAGDVVTASTPRCSATRRAW